MKGVVLNDNPKNSDCPTYTDLKWMVKKLRDNAKAYLYRIHDYSETNCLKNATKWMIEWKPELKTDELFLIVFPGCFAIEFEKWIKEIKKTRKKEKKRKKKRKRQKTCQPVIWIFCT